MGSAAAPLTHAPPGPRGRRGASPHILDATLGPVQKTRRFQGGGWRLEGPPLLLSNQPLRSQFPKRPRAGRGRGGPGRGGGAGGSLDLQPLDAGPPTPAPARLCGPGREETEKTHNSQKNWSSGQRTKVSERAPQLGGEAGPGGQPRLGCSRPPSCARDGAGRRGSPPPPPAPAMQAPLHTDGSHENTYTANGRAREQYARTRPPLPSHPGAVVGVTTSHEPRTARALGCPRPPPGRRRPPGRIKVRRAGRGGCSHRAAPAGTPEPVPPAGTPSGHPRIPCGGGRAPSSPRSSAREGLESM